MDFSKLDTASPAAAGEILQLRHPITGDILEGTTIMLRGSDSPEFQKASQAALNRRLEVMNRKGSGSLVSAEMIQKDMVENLVAVTIGWEGIEMDGNPYSYSPVNARLLFGDIRFPWLREQVDAFVGDRKNFLKASTGK